MPYPPPLVRIAPKIEIDGYSFAFAQTVDSMKATTTGIDTYPLELVPAVTLTPDPQQIMVPAERASQPLTLLTRVRYHGTKAAKVSVGLDAPTGWQFQPIAPLDFSGAGDQLIRFTVTPAGPHRSRARIRCIPSLSSTAKNSPPRSNPFPRCPRAIGASPPT